MLTVFYIVAVVNHSRIMCLCLNVLQRVTNNVLCFLVNVDAKGEHAKSFQVQGVLPSGVPKSQGAVWH